MVIERQEFGVIVKNLTDSLLAASCNAQKLASAVHSREWQDPETGSSAEHRAGRPRDDQLITSGSRVGIRLPLLERRLREIATRRLRRNAEATSLGVLVCFAHVCNGLARSRSCSRSLSFGAETRRRARSTLVSAPISGKVSRSGRDKPARVNGWLDALREANHLETFAVRRARTLLVTTQSVRSPRSKS